MLTLQAGFRGMLGGARLDKLDNFESNAKRLTSSLLDCFCLLVLTVLAPPISLLVA